MMNDAITQSPVFTPEAVRSVLLAAGFSEHNLGEAEGFAIGDGREAGDEILVEVRRRSYGTGELAPWSEEDRVRMQDLLWGYINSLRPAGYRAGIEGRMVVVTETHGGVR